jgi:hypothetical protein
MKWINAICERKLKAVTFKYGSKPPHQKKKENDNL